MESGAFAFGGVFFAVLSILFVVLGVSLPLCLYLIQRNTRQIRKEIRAIKDEFNALNQKTFHLVENSDRMLQIQLRGGGPIPPTFSAELEREA